MQLSAVPLFLVCSIAMACGSPTTASVPITGYRIVSADGSPLTAVDGEAKRLSVVGVLSDGKTTPLSAGTTVTWSGAPVVDALSDDPPTSILPPPAQSATAIWIKNPGHYTDEEIGGVLWVLNDGTESKPTVAVKATLSSSGPSSEATADIAIGPMPAGNVGRGQATYGANCASCHGATGQGTTDFPGLDDAPDHVAGDPAWNAPLFSIAAQSDMDNLGVSLDPSMPKWLIRPSASGQLLTPTDFADIYAFLKTQTE